MRAPPFGHPIALQGGFPIIFSKVKCPTLCDPMDCSLPRSSIHGIFQARVLECLFHIPSHFGVRASPYKFAKDMHQCIAVRKEKKKGRHSLKAWVIGRIAILVMDMVKLR